MSELQKLLLALSLGAQNAASLLSDAVCQGCRGCVGEISDLNRQALSDLADAERILATDPQHSLRLSLAIHSAADCVARAFSASMLLPAALPSLPPLCETVICNAQLSAYPPRLLTSPAAVRPYDVHLCANKGRGALAILLTNVCGNDNGRHLLPLLLALDAHRNALEQLSGLLIGAIPS